MSQRHPIQRFILSYIIDIYSKKKYNLECRINNIELIIKHNSTIEILDYYLSKLKLF